MTSLRSFARGLCALVVAWPLLASAQTPAPPAASTSSGSGAPHYIVDPAWPQELPNNWIMAQVGGMCCDSKDQIWVLQRPRTNTPDELGAEQNPPQSECCGTTPSVLVFDTAGKLVKSWGGPGYVPHWPKNEHGIYVEKNGDVWIGGNDPTDRHILKFNNDGKLLLEIGHPSDAPVNNQDTSILGSPAGIEVDEAAHEVYIADGYRNKRIVVYDSNTGVFKRGWGAYGIPLAEVSNGPEVKTKLSDTLDKQFANPVHAVRLSADGFVYVCDRVNNRIQVFDKQGKFQKEFIVRDATRRAGSCWTVNFSPDKEQKYLLVADGTNNVIWELQRSDGAIVTRFGHSGRNAGQFHWVHQAALDSKGNYYTGEVDTGKRVQKFVLSK